MEVLAFSFFLSCLFGGLALRVQAPAKRQQQILYARIGKLPILAILYM
jgi:hypothetical protein